MSTTYLLPCHCGKRIPIERRHAGETVVCECGAQVQAPTLLRMSALEVVPEPSEPLAEKRTAWNWSHRLILAGVVLLFTAILLFLWAYTERPIAHADVLDPELLRTTAKELPPIMTWNTWELMKQGLDRRVNQAYVTALLYYRVWQTSAIVLAAAGACLLALGVWNRQATASSSDLHVAA